MSTNLRALVSPCKIPSYSCRMTPVSRYLAFLRPVPGYDDRPDNEGPRMRQSQKHGQRKNVTRFCDGVMRQNQELKREERI